MTITEVFPMDFSPNVVREMDLSDPVTGISADPAYGAALVLARLRLLPLGQTLFQIGDQLLGVVARRGFGAPRARRRRVRRAERRSSRST